LFVSYMDSSHESSATGTLVSVTLAQEGDWHEQ
jgi:hypothetical protein